MIKKIVLSIVAIILVATIAIASRYLLAYNGFLDKITTRRPETKSYEVLVKEDSEFNTIEDLKDKNAGLLKSDTKSALAAEHLNEKVALDFDYYDDLSVLIGALSNQITDAIVLESDRIEAIKEEDDNLITDTKTIYTFEIELSLEDVEISSKEITTEPFVVYLSGSDSRHGIKATARSDVNIVAAVNPITGKILLVSIPRDTYVQLHGTTGLKDKLTHAGIYGINMSKTTIEDFLNTNIDYTIKVSFETVIKVVDQLDGIDITSDQPLSLRASNGEMCEFIVGTQHVDGNCALRFARERKSYTAGDRHRGENQQQVITSIIGRLSQSKDYLLKIPTILDIAADSFETTFSRDDVSKFLRRQLTNPINWQVKSISINGAGAMHPTYSMGANRPLYVMLPNAESITEASNLINEYLKNE